MVEKGAGSSVKLMEACLTCESSAVLCPQAVLESKWPSTSQGARLRWAKLRNVLLAVAQFRQPIRWRQKSGSVGSRGGLERTAFTVTLQLLSAATTQKYFLFLFKETMMDVGQKPRPHSTLIRQSSWSGLSESSSHESLTGPLVKSSSLSSMKAPADSKTSCALHVGGVTVY